MVKRFGFGLVLALSIFIVACGQEEKSSALDAGTPTAQALQSSVTGEARAASEADSSPPTTGEQYRLQLEKRLDELDQKIGELRIQARAAGAETKEEFNKAVDDLGKKRAAAAKALGKMREAGEKKWKDVRPEADSAMTDLEKSYEDAVSRFK